MSFSAKLVIAIVIVVSLAFSLGGTLMLANNFETAKNGTIEQNASLHDVYCYTLESRMLSDRLRGSELSTAALARYADQLMSYSSAAALNVTLTDGTVVFSNLGGKLPELDENSYMISAQDEGYFVYYRSAVSVSEYSFTVISGYDISSIYRERERQYNTFLVLQAVVLLCAALAAYVISRAITKPLRTLGAASKKISAGDYGARTAITTKDEIGEFSRGFDRMVDALQKEMDKRTAFVADFSHELKTPMTSMIGYADILRSRRLSEDDKFRYADIIYKNSKRLENLSAKMLSMLGLSEEEIVLAPVSMIQIERRLKQLFGQETDIIYELASETVTAEQELLLTLLRNLAENAVKASDGTPVRVVGGTADGRYTVQVIDKGKGMSEEQLCRAAEPFYKADFSRTDGGCGIGLSICKKICELFGTELIIESEQGRGTTVSFSLEVFHE